MEANRRAIIVLGLVLDLGSEDWFVAQRAEMVLAPARPEFQRSVVWQRAGVELFPHQLRQWPGQVSSLFGTMRLNGRDGSRWLSGFLQSERLRARCSEPRRCSGRPLIAEPLCDRVAEATRAATSTACPGTRRSAPKIPRAQHLLLRGGTSRCSDVNLQWTSARRMRSSASFKQTRSAT